MSAARNECQHEGWSGYGYCPRCGVAQESSAGLRIRTGTARCKECGRVFDLADPTDSAEWHYGHDCEVDA